MRASISAIALIVAAGVAVFEDSFAATVDDQNRGDGVRRTAADDAPIRTWTAVFIEADTSKPLPGIQVDAQTAISGESDLQDQLLVSDESGEIKIPLRKGTCTTLNIKGPGWCRASGIPIVGDMPAEWLDHAARPRNPDRPITIKLFRGTEVQGRLLLPNGEPAADVTLIAGVHCNQPPWISQAYIDRLMSHTYSVSEWPNWNATTTTADDGSFRVTVPPSSVRGWIRVGTISGDWQAIDASRLASAHREHALVRFAPFEIEVDRPRKSKDADDVPGDFNLGELRLSKGITLRGRVVDAEGRPLSGVHLLTSSARGPYAGRKAVSQADGSFEFLPMNSGAFRLSPDAHLRNAEGEKTSRDVQAVFVSQEVTLSDDVNPQELILRALPHVELAFEWVDRRVEKGPVSYYGGFALTGEVPRDDGSKARWRGETVRLTRRGSELLVVKVPEAVVGLTIGLHPDERVTPSYHDDLIEGASGQVALGSATRQVRRIIYGDEPKGGNNP